METCPYNTYRETTIEWMPLAPNHWDDTFAKISFDIQLGKMLQNKPENYDDTEIPYLKALHVNWEGITTSGLPFMYASDADKNKYQVVIGDLLVCEGGEVGRAAILKNLEEPTIIQNALHRVRSTKLGNISYFKYLLRNIADAGWFGILCNKATIAHLTGEKLGAIRIPLPSIKEQIQIAKFLDYKTSQIDCLIKKKKALIEKLNEKRIAVITQAVTKGLDPNVLMKDSEIDWLGEVPTHWQVRPLKFCFEFLNNRRIPLSAEERTGMLKNFPYYGASGIIDEVENYIFDEPTVLVAEDGANLLSRSTPLAFEATGKYWVNNHAHILKPIAGPFGYWSNLLCNVPFDPWITGSAQPKLTKDNLGTIPLPHPPVDEQKHIYSFIQDQIDYIDPLISLTGSTIHQLEEYRTAIIAAAVTGKIDVHNFEIPEARK